MVKVITARRLGDFILINKKKFLADLKFNFYFHKPLVSDSRMDYLVFLSPSGRTAR